ncbi:TVP38/TMEM64 family protein [Ellagibacter isourolithinifaciens]|uniref:TVP38/TMEM64 family protein n=1 Tax=Ellagibacter isourolithinifaciens TaxID=2137581 RepID=UPI003A9577D6
MASKRNAWVSRIAIAVVVVVAACFWIARSLGCEAVEKLCSKTGLTVVEQFFERHGDQSVLIARLLPFVSFDFVSYFAGLTSMPLRASWSRQVLGSFRRRLCTPMWTVCSLVVQRCWSQPCSFSLRSRRSLFWRGGSTASMHHAARRGQTRRQCLGSLAGSVRVVHALSALMGVDETPAVATTVLNRAKAASEGTFACGSAFLKRYFLPQLGHRSARKHSSHFGRRAMHVSRPKSTH